MRNITITTRLNLRFLSSLLNFSRRSTLLLARALKRSKKGFIGFMILLYFIGMSVIGGVIIPLDITVNIEKRFESMSFEHILGTDGAGRDIFALIIHGSRNILITALIAGLITVFIGTSIGLITGFKGGKIDIMLMFVADVGLTVPGVPLILVIASAIGYGKISNPFLLGAILSIMAWASLARSIRSQVLSLKEREFVEAAKTLGLSTSHIIFHEILPNILYYISINFLYAMVGAVYAHIGLFFLGILPFDVTNWGLILNFAQQQAVFYTEGLLTKGALIGPILHIVLLQTGLVLLCSSLEEFFNPRLRED